MTRSPVGVVVAALVGLLVAAATLPAACRAEWVDVPDTNDLVIRQVGQFAVLVYGLAHHKDLAFLAVVRGQTQDAVGGGTNYRLVVAAAKPGDGHGSTTTTAEYDCLVWGVPGSSSDTWKLRRFRKIQQA
ncbi:unnamed protein product [Urochloa humidicola]